MIFITLMITGDNIIGSITEVKIVRNFVEVRVVQQQYDNFEQLLFSKGANVSRGSSSIGSLGFFLHLLQHRGGHISNFALQQIIPQQR